VAGYEFNGTKNVTKCWKNGVTTNLSDGTKFADANAITVVGNDVYVDGYEYNGNNSVAKYCRNGVETNLSDGIKAVFTTGIIV